MLGTATNRAHRWEEFVSSAALLIEQSLEGVCAPLRRHSMRLSTGHTSPSLCLSLCWHHATIRLAGLPWWLIFDRMLEGSIKWLSAEPTYPPHPRPWFPLQCPPTDLSPTECLRCEGLINQQRAGREGYRRYQKDLIPVKLNQREKFSFLFSNLLSKVVIWTFKSTSFGHQTGIKKLTSGFHNNRSNVECHFHRNYAFTQRFDSYTFTKKILGCILARFSH